MIVGVAEGKVTIVAMSANAKQTAACEVTVVPASVTGITSLERVYLGRTKKLVLPVVIEPGDAPNQEVVWPSSHPGIVAIGANGTMKAMGTGTAMITVTTKDGGYAAQIIVNVPNVPKKLAGITVAPAKATLMVGQRGRIKAALKPQNAANAIITYTSSHAHIASVDALGHVTALSPGVAKITVKAGQYTRTITITVNQ